MLDYSEYSKNGFFITESNSVSFDYTPLATVVVTMQRRVDEEWVYVNGTMCRSENRPTAAKVLNKAVEEAKQLGANALINLKLEPLNTTGIMLTGMAIKK